MPLGRPSYRDSHCLTCSNESKPITVSAGGGPARSRAAARSLCFSAPRPALYHYLSVGSPYLCYRKNKASPPADAQSWRGTLGREALFLFLNLLFFPLSPAETDQGTPRARRLNYMEDQSPDDAGQTTGRRSRRAGRDEEGREQDFAEISRRIGMYERTRD